jgi:hypothetical protein
MSWKHKAFSCQQLEEKLSLVYNKPEAEVLSTYDKEKVMLNLALVFE